VEGEEENRKGLKSEVDKYFEEKVKEDKESKYNSLIDKVNWMSD
jgi:hypothetical protein